jgi:MFS family permease
MSTFHGIVYWSNLFYVPLYLQDVRGYSPVLAGLIILPMVATQGVGSMVSGQIISRTGHYNPMIISGNLVWVIGASLQIIYNRTTPVYAICLIGLLQGIGIGCAFQRMCPKRWVHVQRLIKLSSGSCGLTSALTKSRQGSRQLSPQLPPDNGRRHWADQYAPP